MGENGIGLVCPPRLEELVETAQRAAAMTDDQRRAMSQAARAFYEANFTMDRLVTILEQMLAEEIRKQKD